MFDDLGDLHPEKVFMLYSFKAKISLGTFLSSLKDCNITLTMNHNLIVTTYSNNEEKLLIIEGLAIFKKDSYIKDTFITLTYVKKGLMFSSSKELRFCFDSAELVKEFKEKFLMVKETVQPKERK